MEAAFGHVEHWEDARGFGFVRPESSVVADGERLFVHIHDFDAKGQRPEVGMRVRFTPQRQADGRWRARRVARVGHPGPAPRTVPTRRSRPATGARRGKPLLSAALAAWCVLLGAALYSARAPAITLPALGGLNLLTFIAYALDKHAARHHRWRTPEAHLHLLELLGGWPAAALAQRVLRHKNAKTAYQRSFAAIIVLHLIGLGIWTFA